MCKTFLKIVGKKAGRKRDFYIYRKGNATPYTLPLHTRSGAYRHGRAFPERGKMGEDYGGCTRVRRI